MKQISFAQMKQINKDISSLQNKSVHHCHPIFLNDKDRIRTIINSAINIQSILARNYHYKRDLGVTVLYDSTLLLTNNIDEELEMFASIFNEVIVVKRADGIPINIQVSYPNDLAYEVFGEMITENKIDEYVKYFYINRHYKQDFCQQAYFEIDKQGCKKIENRYFNYLINGTNSPTMLNPLYIDVSGFNLDEIENDEYVQQLATQVKHLYLMVWKSETPEISFYIKQLRWYL